MLLIILSVGLSLVLTVVAALIAGCPFAVVARSP
jgi:hypothetical protein